LEDYYFFEELPLALEYGMTPQQFWEEDEDLFYVYQQAYVNKKHNEAHLIGLYVELAIEIGVNNLFAKKSEKQNYPYEDVYNPLKANKEKTEKSLLSTIDTSKNNNGIYSIKKMIEERRKVNNG
jgi:hypothetical protein